MEGNEAKNQFDIFCKQDYAQKLTWQMFQSVNFNF
jgi:hypothetical protein